jgi:hypothetical protein
MRKIGSHRTLKSPMAGDDVIVERIVKSEFHGVKEARGQKFHRGDNR